MPTPDTQQHQTFYLWDMPSLIQAFKENRFSGLSEFIYTFFWAALVAVSMEVMTHFPLTGLNHWDVVLSFANTFIALGAMIFCYRANGGNAGKHFAIKIYAITFVALVRTLWILVLLYALLSWLHHQQGTLDLFPNTSAEVVLFSLWHIGYMYYTYRCIQQTR